MEQLVSYLLALRGDIFKMLPMKEAEEDGVDNHVGEYLEAMVVNMTGAMKTYPLLATEKHYLYVLNNLNYLHENEVEFPQWRKVILSSTNIINKLYDYYGG